MDRRQFIGASLGVGVGAALLASACGVQAAPALRTHATLVYERQFPEAHRFAESGAAMGAAVLAFDGDVAQLWYEHLSGAVAGGVPIVGLGTQGLRFCIQTFCGADVRFVFHAHHAPQGLRQARVYRDLGRRDIDALSTLQWPEHVARIALRHTTLRNTAVTVERRAFAAVGDAEPGYLESWALVSRRNAITYG